MIPIRDTIPRRRAPVATWLMIAANVAAFAYELSLAPEQLERLVERCGILPASFFDADWAAHLGRRRFDLWPFVTSLFLHGGWLHLLGNMWTLAIFGDNVEDRMGPMRFLVFYVACGIAAGVVHLVTNTSSTVPALGASGAIAGVMGAYFLLFPHARVVTLIPVFFWPVFVEIPALVFLGVWFLAQFFSGTLALARDSAAEGIAWWAHVGGFLAGIVLLGVFVRRPPRRARAEAVPGAPRN